MTIFLLPFLASIGMSQSNNLLGGMGQDASFYPVFLGLIVWGIQLSFMDKKMIIPKSLSFYFLLLFLSILLVSGIINTRDILDAQLYEKTGVSRYVIQVGTIFLYSLGALYFYNFFCEYRGNIYSFVRFWLILSLCLATAYSAIEILSFFYEWAGEFLYFLDCLFRGSDTEQLVNWRVRSLAFEASLFGTYLSAAFPWLCLAALEKQGKYVVLLLVCIGLIVLSFSRTSYAICMIQFILIIYFFRGKLVRLPFKTIFSFFLLSFVALVVSTIVFRDIIVSDDIIETFFAIWTFDSSIKEVSNLTRYGSQMAAISIFFEHPLLGIGWGQAAIHLTEYFPSWAWASIEVRDFFQYAPVVFGIYPRILAEVGILGLLTWLAVWGGVIIAIYKNFPEQEHLQGKILIVSIIGVLLSGFNMDIFHFWAYWLFLGMAWALETKEGRC
jgi:O-Antigen ligase.